MGGELKPCPWCESDDVEAFYDSRINRNTKCYVHCHDCRAHGPLAHTNSEAKIEWNRRTQPTDSGWISVEDRLPEIEMPVWMYDPDMRTPMIGSRVDLGFVDEHGVQQWGWATAEPWHNGKRWDCDPDDYDAEYGPSHWMPLPEPPNSEAEPTDSVCEWRSTNAGVPVYRPKCSNAVNRQWAFKDFTYCPYCGKPISIKDEYHGTHE